MSPDDLDRALAHAAHLLPAQAPLDVFVHHNTLHAYEERPFHEALNLAARELSARTYLPLASYTEAHGSGRIRDEDLDAVLAERPLVTRGGGPIGPGLPTVEELARAAFVRGVGPTPAATLRWRMEERAETAGTDAAAALWAACRDACRPHHRPGAPLAAPTFPRDALALVSLEDPADAVHATLVPLCGAFLDRGQAHWDMPGRDEGFFSAWTEVVTSGHAVRPSWLATLGHDLREMRARGLDAHGAALWALRALGVDQGALGAFVTRSLRQLPGWAGMFHRLERAPAQGHVRVRLVDFFAVRLVLDSLAWIAAARELGHAGAPATIVAFCAERLRGRRAPDRDDHDTTWPLFQLLSAAGATPEAVRAAPPEAIARALEALDGLDDHARALRWHEAYERRYREALLGALHQQPRAAATGARPRFQIVTCIDDRIESLRRHFEEQDPAHETLGAPGFFNLAIAYQGIDDPSTFPLCPVVVEPRHRIEEEPASEHRAIAEERARRIRRWGRLRGAFGRGTRSLLFAPFWTAVSGFVAAPSLLLQVFTPLLAERLRKGMAHRLLPKPRTRLVAERPDDAEGPVEDRALLSGFTQDEQAARVATLLENMGLVRDFARLVTILGHDSTSVNNPHLSAYSCGACGGRSGGPNARLFARMANQPEVRARLRERGIEIPDDTVFIAAVHDTCADVVGWFDEGDLPASHAEDRAALKVALDEALERNAHERCRRFASAARHAATGRARLHVEERAADLSQARPELGHATNASCIVGRRALTRGLFLDRRAFLVSYDAALDPSGDVLERVLASVAPVGAGINLEYFFSTVDNAALGAGTKLPHNVTALVGVMDGASSDLRTGLPRQMIEIHEPVRLQMVIEAEEETILRAAGRQPGVMRLVQNAWVIVVAAHPETGALAVFDPARGFTPWPGREAPPALASVARSSDWYAGKDGFVGPARVVPEGARA